MHSLTLTRQVDSSPVPRKSGHAPDIPFPWTARTVPCVRNAANPRGSPCSARAPTGMAGHVAALTKLDGLLASQDENAVFPQCPSLDTKTRSKNPECLFFSPSLFLSQRDLQLARWCFCVSQYGLAEGLSSSIPALRPLRHTHLINAVSAAASPNNMALWR
ncbi:hypothetical protein LX36DRAFT_417821 [Colletotrichum falcatum]|nr:hypothetical protein LX36DRAFT_417821 [Colletotrichum falcatum]